MSKKHVELFFKEIRENKKFQDEIINILIDNADYDKKRKLLKELASRNYFDFTKDETLSLKSEILQDKDLKNIDLDSLENDEMSVILAWYILSEIKLS